MSSTTSRYSGTWDKPNIPAGEVVNIKFGNGDGTYTTMAVPVTPAILTHITGTKEGSYHCINLRYVLRQYPQYRSASIL